jgi:hypothetical protein
MSSSTNEPRPAAELLALIPHHLTRAALDAEIDAAVDAEEIEAERSDRTGTLARMQRWGGTWRAYAGELGIPCPPGLVELADAMAAVRVYVGADHGWDLLTPDESREARESVAAARDWWKAHEGLFAGRIDPMAGAYPSIEARARMAPVFGQDGDLLLLAADGRVHAFTHDGWEHDGVVAESFDELLRGLAKEVRARRSKERAATMAGPGRSTRRVGSGRR